MNYDPSEPYTEKKIKVIMKVTAASPETERFNGKPFLREGTIHALPRHTASLWIENKWAELADPADAAILDHSFVQERQWANQIKKAEEEQRRMKFITATVSEERTATPNRPKSRRVGAKVNGGSSATKPE